MDIRELTASDRDAATGLWAEAGLVRPWNDPASDFDRAVRGTTSTVLGAVDAGGVAATVMVGHDGHRGWVYYLAVEPGRRRSGLGRHMMRTAEGWLRQRGSREAQPDGPQRQRPGARLLPPARVRRRRRDRPRPLARRTHVAARHDDALRRGQGHRGGPAVTEPRRSDRAESRRPVRSSSPYDGPISPLLCWWSGVQSAGTRGPSVRHCAEVVVVPGPDPRPLGGRAAVQPKLATLGAPTLRPALGRVLPGLLPAVDGQIQQSVRRRHQFVAAAGGPVGLVDLVTVSEIARPGCRSAGLRSTGPRSPAAPSTREPSSP